MIGFLLRRLGWSLLTIWFVVSATFAMTFAIPADPARTLVGPHGDAETIARVRRAYCLDRGFVGQYGCFVGRIAKGDLGESFRSHRPVVEIILDRVWPTTQLAMMAMLLQLLLALPLGLIAAVQRDRGADVATNVVGVLGQSAPTFFVGALLVYGLGYRAGWFPVSGYGHPGWDRLAHIFLPALTLAFTGLAYYARLLRSEMVEVLQEDFVRTARAKGLGERRVVLVHAFRNALGPVITLIGLDLGVLMGGAVVTETIFAWPGLGREVLQAILELDLPLIIGVVLFTAGAIVVANLLVDLAYAWVDPRVRLGERR